MVSNIMANWDAITNVTAFTTTRFGGYSIEPFSQNNLGLHVGDLEQAVLMNRKNTAHKFMLPNEPQWLEQIHSNQCIRIEDSTVRIADGVTTNMAKCVLVIMTADCLPILLCNRSGTEIAAVHAGWRGLVDGIIANTVNMMFDSPNNLVAWIGPAICVQCFEIGIEVRDLYLKKYNFLEQYFVLHDNQWFANLIDIAVCLLKQCGITVVYKSNICTFEQQNFFSYRRDGVTGRMGTFIWLNE